MKNVMTLMLSVIIFTLLGCKGETPFPTGLEPGSSSSGLTQALGESSSLLGGGDKGPPIGECPDYYYESTKEIRTGDIVHWRSSFNGFNYTKGDNYTVTVEWWVEGNGTAEFQSFKEKNNTWTPKKDVDGTWSYDDSNVDDGSLDLTVNMSSMHRSVEEDWTGHIGNGHFKLEIKVDGVKVKMGVNVHLEDPDNGEDPRCP